MEVRPSAMLKEKDWGPQNRELQEYDVNIPAWVLTVRSYYVLGFPV